MIRLFFVFLVMTSTVFGLDFKEDSQKALKENKLILVSVESENCRYCKKMHNELFNIEKNSQEIVKEYVYNRIVVENDKLPLDLKVKYFPTHFIVDPKNNKVVDEFVGYIKADDFISFLDMIYKQEVLHLDPEI